MSLAILALAVGCSAPGSRAPSPGVPVDRTRPPSDVVLITADTLRRDATGFSGAGLVETPLLDRLAASGTVFDAARSHAVVTLPSHASILTGLYPYEHGIHDNAGFVLAEGVDTLAGLLRAQGFATGAFVSALPLDRRYGLDRGFDVYDDEYEGYGDPLVTLPERPGEETVARAVAWWKAGEGRRRFLWVHLFTPHFPYEPEEPFASRYAGRPYYGEAATMDAQLGPLLEPLLADAAGRNVLVLFTADHGESLGEHGEQTHGTFAYDSTLRVPLVVSWPGGLGGGARRDEPVWHVDLLPTVLDLLGLALPDGLPGHPLFGEAAAPRENEGYFEALAPYFNRGWAPLTGLMRGETKAIRLPVAELYDLARDPGEQHNRAADEPGALEELVSGLPALSTILAPRTEVDAETLARLRQLGYAAANAAPDPAVASDPAHDPKSLIELEGLLDAAMGARRQGQPERAVSILREVLARQADMPLAYVRLAEALLDLGRKDEAVTLLQEARERGVDDESVRRGLALGHLARGRPEAAARTLEHDASSRDPETLVVLGRALAQSGKPAEAHRLFERALAIDPSYPAVGIDLGILSMMEGRLDEARTELEQALGRDPYHAEGWNALGVIHSRQNRPEEARRAWQHAVEVDPRAADALYNLAASHAKSGDLAQAIAAMERYSTLVEGAERQKAQAILDDLRRRAGHS
jgi:arylsulfatase A-like enzyme/Flp pilus assembly protein TadD